MRRLRQVVTFRVEGHDEHALWDAAQRHVTRLYGEGEDIHNFLVDVAIRPLIQDAAGDVLSWEAEFEVTHVGDWWEAEFEVRPGGD